MESPRTQTPQTAAVVLAGGRASRLGGIDKTRVDLPGGTPLERVLAACPPGIRVIVGPAGEGTPEGASVVREDPPFSGPVAALGCGVTEVRRRLAAGDQDPAGGAAAPADAGGDLDVLVLAGDLPHVRAGTLRRLLVAAPPGSSERPVRCARDAQGRLQYLCSAWPLDVLVAALDAVRAPGPVAGGLAGIGMHRLVGALPPERLRIVDLETAEIEDIDTPADLDRARALRSRAAAGPAPSPAPTTARTTRSPR